MANDSRDFIGRGWKFPIEFKKSTGTVTMLTHEENIRNSLYILFTTRIGERIMQPDFGSELDSFIFSGVSKSMITYLEAVIANTILFNEPRIILNNVEINVVNGESFRLDIEIQYTVSATNNRYNYVYPFYIREATNLSKY